jgi:hypothetical protein
VTNVPTSARANGAEIERIAQLIADYMRLHPNAADEMNGVLWWIPELSTEPKSHLQGALDLLVARGVIARKTRVDGTVIYGAVASG